MIVHSPYPEVTRHTCGQWVLVGHYCTTCGPDAD